MENEVYKKFTWVIKHFPILPYQFIRSDEFLIDGCTWRLMACPEGKVFDRCLFLFLNSTSSLPCGWRRQTRCRLTIVNQLEEKFSKVEEQVCWFLQMGHRVGFPITLNYKDNGFLVNGEAKVVIEIEVLEESDEVTKHPLKKIKRENGSSSTGLHKETSSVGNEADKKFTWVIKLVPSLPNEYIYSDIFVIDGCTWRLMAHPVGKGKAQHLSLFLCIATSLPCQWRRHAKYCLFVLNQLSGKLCQVGEAEERWFHQRESMAYFPIKLAKDNGFLLNGESKVVVEIEVLEFIGELDVVSKESEEATQHPLKKIKPENGESSTGLHKETSSVNECVDVNGFHVLPSQVESLKLIFERHPDMALELRLKNQHLKTACMNTLINLIQTLCQSQLCYDDLIGADSALTYVKDSGFKVDWLEQKLKEVKERKKEEQNGEIRMQQLEKELEEFKQKCSDLEVQLKDSKQKCSDIEALLEKEKAKLLATRASPLKLDDVV